MSGGIVKAEVLGTHRRAVELKQAAALEDAVEDRLGEIVVVQHPAPGGERLVGGEDHRAPALVALVDDVEEHVGGVGAVGEVADLVDDEHGRVGVARERLGEPPLAVAAERSSMSSAAVVNRASKPFWIAR